MAQRPDLRPRALPSNERIVLRHGAVPADANDLPEVARKILSLPATVEDRPFAEHDEERAVRSEDETPARVHRRLEGRLHAEDDLDLFDFRCRSAVQYSPRDRESISAFARLVVRPVDPPAGREIGRQLDVEEPSLAAPVDSG
jgi:hypothetical protein